MKYQIIKHVQEIIKLTYIFHKLATSPIDQLD